MEKKLRKNDLIPLEITALGHEGNGIGRYDGLAVFVPKTAVGDRITARLVKLHSSYAFGIVEELIEPSTDRVEDDCPAFRHCGGCALRHISYEAELAAKEGWVRENLRRIGGVEAPCEPIIASVQSDRYRNKAQYPIRRVNGEICAGFFARRSHRLVPLRDCLLQPESFAGIIDAVTGYMKDCGVEPYDEERHEGVVRHLFIRRAASTGTIMVWLIINAKELPHSEKLVERLRAACPAIASIGIDRNRKRTNVIFGGDLQTLYGSDTITDRLCGVEIELSPLSFYQVNPPTAEKLFETARALAAPGPEDRLLDLYCGAGIIGLSMAGAVKEVVGVEVVPQAVENARQNAARNGIANARFLCADAGKAARQLLAEGWRPSIILLDPPRKGADEAVIDCIAALAPEKLVYISCNSATLARDVALLAVHGYRVKRVRAADFFPRTTGVECCCLLEREPIEA